MDNKCEKFYSTICFDDTSGVHRNFVRGSSTNSVEDREKREWGSGGGSPLVRGSGGSCILEQEISYSKIFLIFL